MPSPSGSFSIRAAQAGDFPAIHAIQVHYVQNTVMNFSYEPASVEAMLASWDSVVSAGYPYIVATKPSDDARGQDLLIGYAYVHTFRERLAYQYTGELSIFVDSKRTSCGAGKVLLDTIIQELAQRSQLARNWDSDESKKHAGERRPVDVHQLIACMSVEPDAVLADKLKRFYEREGFVETARLKKVGWKFGQWLDTRYMQRELR